MGLFDTLAILITLSALFGYVNHRFIRLPMTIGLMAMSLIGSLLLIGLHEVGLPLDEPVEAMLLEIDFDRTLLDGMLSFLLFAGALHVNLDDLAEHGVVIGVLATLGVVMSTVLVGFAMYLGLGLLGTQLSLGFCLVFGALISPTDPIAVLSILKKAGAPRALETKITGESLFNDGVAVVVFVLLVEVFVTGHDVSLGHALFLFAKETGGGLALGLSLGALAYWLLKAVDDRHVEVLVTLAVVTGGYALALNWHLSGPIAVVVAGLFVGNHGRRLAMSDRTRATLDTVWEFIDELLNAVLFVLIGLEVLVVQLSASLLVAGGLAIVVSLLARFVAVSLPVVVLRRYREFAPNTVKLLVWGGLRGGISVALALSLVPGPQREAVLTMTYVVVVFSILVQGLTIGRVAAGATREATESAS
jgi:CPA1 family monovalent cation:H+ antiporter